MLLLHRIEEVHCAEDIAMIGNGRGRLANLADVRSQFVDVARPVQKRIIRMKMEVGKLCCHSSSLEPSGTEENEALIPRLY